MTQRAEVAAEVPLPPERARALWTDVRRWPNFVEGFARELERRGDWPAEGATLVWSSTPGGRGRVTERVVESGDGVFATRVSEEALRGVQRARFLPAGEGARVELALDYELSRGGPVRALADLLFIRRALRDALRRTLRRFRVEAEEEARTR